MVFDELKFDELTFSSQNTLNRTIRNLLKFYIYVWLGRTKLVKTKQLVRIRCF